MILIIMINVMKVRILNKFFMMKYLIERHNHDLVVFSHEIIDKNMNCYTCVLACLVITFTIYM